MEAIKSMLPTNLRSSEHAFMLPASKVESIRTALGLTQRELLCLLTQVAKEEALPPISHFKVGAVALCESGNVYMGVNIEFPGLSLGFSIHGEQFLLTRVAQAGEKLKALAVNEVPCGHCRQFLKEVRDNSEISIYVRETSYLGVPQILPNGFGPSDLLTDVPYNLLDNINLNLKVKNEEDSSLLSLALSGQALEKSYDFACELIIDNPQYAGFYIESAAYNPSLSPLHTMLINLWADGGAWSDIEEVLLVEHEDAVVSQQCFAKSMQEKVFPGAKLSVHYFSNDK